MISPILPTYNRAPLTFERGEGSWLITTDGDRYLDFAAGIAVNVLGHANPVLVEALTAQANKMWHVSNLYHIAEQEALAERLVAHSFADTCFFTNSGTEAAELAVKMVRKFWTTEGQPERFRILTFEGSFHGRSSAAIAAAGSEKMVKGFGPLLPGFTQLPWGDVAAIREHIFADDIAAVMFEPVLGEGGIRPVPDADLKAIRALCDEAGVLLVLDEVQCGIGRTGKLFAYEWAGISPDIMMVGKGIGGGFPLGALLATENAAKGMTAGSHGSTYGGNPLACAVGNAVMDVVATPEFLGEVNRKAGLLRQGLEALVASHPDVFEEVRGAGLMMGLKCKPPAGELVNAGYAANVLTVGAADNVVRLLPALNIPDADIAEGLQRLDAAATALGGK
ncbi:aspartate aminotransferase family protein [Ketogulonicigenium vulgare]|uniref:aspartate aminotransferase family protein n=1 Tax=Ketogulonicigenium vulgare TaxID=92945 RepID=UPI0023585C8F|nr:aspartate aminotransferase family protein [Ketogulonicigenium vulgare]